VQSISWENSSLAGMSLESKRALIVINIEVMQKYVYRMGLIKKDTWQAFVTWLLNVGLTYLKNYEITYRRGLS
jgi:hypothetical protein